MPLIILHHLLNVFVQLANKRGFTKNVYMALTEQFLNFSLLFVPRAVIVVGFCVPDSNEIRLKSEPGLDQWYSTFLFAYPQI
jgi:hypothetical protein